MWSWLRSSNREDGPRTLFATLWLATLFLSMLVLPTGAVAGPIDDLEQLFPAIDQAVDGTDEQLRAATGVDVAPAWIDGVAVSGVADADIDVTAWGRAPRPLAIATPTTWGDWASVEFAGGEVRFRLVDRGQPSDSTLRTNDVLFENVQPGVDQFMTTSDAGLEEFLVVSGSAADDEQEFAWDVELPSGFSVRSNDGSLSIIGSDGAELLRVTAPTVEDEAGNRFTPALDWDTQSSQVVVRFDPNVGAVGSWVLDPLWDTTVTVGRFQRQYCRSTSGASCATAATTSPDLPTGWTAHDPASKYTTGSVAGEGLSIHAKSSTAYNNLDYARLYYVPPPYTHITQLVYQGNSAGYDDYYFQCRLEGGNSLGTMDFGGAYSPPSPYNSYVHSDSIGNGTTNELAWAGLTMYSVGAHSFGTPSATCNQSGSADYIIVHLKDTTNPDVIDPDTIAADSYGSNVQWQNMDHWYKSGDVVQFPYRMTDTGSGAYQIEPYFNYGGGANQYIASKQTPCTPDSTGLLPCPLEITGSLAVTLSSTNTKVEGVNDFRYKVYDFSGKDSLPTGSSSGGKYLYDSTAPGTPTNPVPSSGATDISNGSFSTEGSSITWLTWTAPTDSGCTATPQTGSCISYYEIKLGTSSDLSSVAWEKYNGFPYYPATVAASGTYYWQVRAVDFAGNAGSASSVWNFEVDQTPPTTAITAPATGISKRASGNETFSATASDSGSAIASVTFERRPAGSSTWTGMGAATLSSGVYSLAADLPSDGLWQVRAVATDSAWSTPNVNSGKSITICRDTSSPTNPTTAKHKCPASRYVSPLLV